MTEMTPAERRAFADAAEAYFASTESAIDKIYAEAVMNAMLLSTGDITLADVGQRHGRHGASPILGAIAALVQEPDSPSQ